MTGNFKEFKVESPTNTATWDEQNAMVNTAVRNFTLLQDFWISHYGFLRLIPVDVSQDYLASIDNTAQAHSSFT